MLTRTMLAGFGLIVAAAAPANNLSAQELEAGSGTIIETASAIGTFHTFEKALKTAGLIEMLQGQGPFTVFAPTDEAFAKLPAGQLDSLMNDAEALQRLLLTHVIEGEISGSSAMQMAGAGTETVSGVRAKIVTRDGKLRVQQSTVTRPDILASNGIIHAIDTVIIPIDESYIDPR